MDYNKRLRRLDDLRTAEITLYNSIKQDHPDIAQAGYLLMRDYALAELICEYRSEIEDISFNGLPDISRMPKPDTGDGD
ncbi:hypothetical protein LCGC14_0535150 [marine sediment metagenome]|uniref:Uncharacterized protein n=1 Tax=marine sediment metagenome TaxID=412755 RepID=A0A0F9SCV6_9ZZZZ